MHWPVCPVKTVQFNNGLPTWNMVKLSDQDRAGAVGYQDMSNLAGQSAMSQQYSMRHPPLLVILSDFIMRLVVLRIVPDPEGQHDQQVNLTIVPYNEYTMGSHTCSGIYI